MAALGIGPRTALRVHSNGRVAAVAAALEPRCPAAARWQDGRVAGRRHFAQVQHPVLRRVDYPWKNIILRQTWHMLKKEMVDHFEQQPERDSTVHLRAAVWPRFTQKEILLEQSKLPGLITGFGPHRKIVMNKAEIEAVAFDEKDGHMSHLFKGRLFRIHVGDWIEECVVDDFSAHSVQQELYFVRFRRHVPGQVTTLPIPVSLSGLWGCPGYRAGGHVDLAMPTIDCEVIGEKIPPPFVIDVTQLQLESPYSAITLEELKEQLPEDGSARFSRHLPMDSEVVMCYEARTVPEVPLPSDWEDPNFIHRGGRYNLTYTGFWPKQTTRA